MHQPETVVPQCFSTPSTAAAIAFPFSAALSKRAIASYKHFAMSSKAITSPFSTTGKCLNFPVEKKLYAMN